MFAEFTGPRSQEGWTLSGVGHALSAEQTVSSPCELHTVLFSPRRDVVKQWVIADCSRW